MPNERLEPGARPKKKYLEPVKGPDGIWRLDRVRHRRYNGLYTRTSASGYTRKECLDEWEKAFERNRSKGSARRTVQRRTFELTDPMLIAFEAYFDLLQKRVDRGKLTQKAFDLYWNVTYRIDSPNARAGTIRLSSEMGALSIGEVGKPQFLAEYLEDVADVVPGIAAQQYQVLKGTFSMLTKAGLYLYSPMAPISQPELAEPSMRALFPHETSELYEAICARITRVHYFRMLFLILLGTGIRPGEAISLWWSDCPDLSDDTIEKAVLRVGTTGVKPVFGGPTFRQDKRKHGRVGVGYYITLPRWLTAELRAYKKAHPPKSEDSLILLSQRRSMVAPDTARSTLDRAKAGTSVEWMTWGNLRDTVATHVAGRTGDPRRASAQLGHSEGARMATGHYIDPQGYVRAVVDNSEFLEELNPMKTGAKLESGRS